MHPNVGKAALLALGLSVPGVLSHQSSRRCMQAAQQCMLLQCASKPCLVDPGRMMLIAYNCTYMQRRDL
jgi:hypothetical protein